MSEIYNSRYDECQQNLENLAEYYSQNIASRNEAATRLHLIDTLLLDCLAWEKHDLIPEEHQRRERNEYTDYTFYAPRRIMILEAKRESDTFEIPAGKVALTYSIKSLWRGNPGLKSAIEQAAGYCQSRGVPIAVVCNGHQLVAFTAVRTDGVAPMDGKCLAFCSLGDMLKHFVDFWNALSRSGIEDRNLLNRLLGSHQPELAPPLSASISDYPGTKGRNVIQAELKHLSELVIEDIPESAELEEDFLKNCYCQSGALSQHSLASKAILRARYAALFDRSSAQRPTVIPATTRKGVSQELYAESMSRRPILLLGEVGVGKSIFIRHLIGVEASDLLQNAICLRIDLGTHATLTPELRDYVVSEIISQLDSKYSVNIEAAGFVRGVYHGDLQKLRNSIYGELLKTKPSKFHEKEFELIERKLRDKGEHCRRCLEHLGKARKHQIVVFIDNADQRLHATQDEAFLIAQEMASRWPVLVYVPLRPETFHRSVGEGALSGYHPKAFTVAPPRIDRVLEKRLKYALSITDGVIPSVEFTADATQLNNLKTVIRSFQKSLRTNEDLLECIDNMAGGNVRLALSLVKGFFGSGHVDTAKIVKRSEKRLYEVALHEFLRASIYGDHVYYHPDRSPFANLFDISAKDPKEHFLLPIFLGILRQAGHANKGFVESDEIYPALQGLGFTPEQIDFAVVRAYRKRLIDTPASQSPQREDKWPRMFRATTVGLYHVDRLCSQFAYVDAMVVATPILDVESRDSIQDVHTIEDRLQRAMNFRRYLSEQWTAAAFPPLAFHWPSAEAELEADMNRILGVRAPLVVKASRGLTLGR